MTTDSTASAEPRESIPQRQARIMRDHNISFRESFRVALAESRLERALEAKRNA